MLVVLVVYLFLQSFRTTIICTVAIVVALIATFTGMLALGFSINLLTLFGLVLAIGMVVDDAIVVCENVERNMHQHHLGAQGGDDQLDGRDRELARRRRARDVLGVHSGGVPAGHHRPALQAVRDHDRDLGVGVGLLRADHHAGDVRGAAQAQPAADARAVRVVQPPGRPRHAGVRRRRDLRHQVRGRRAGPARGVPLLDLSTCSRCCRRASCPTRTRATRSRRSSCRRRRASRARRRSPTRADDDLQGDPRRADAHRGHRLQPARQRLQDQRRHDLRHVQRLRRSATRTSTRRRRRTCARSCRRSSRRRARSRARS